MILESRFSKWFSWSERRSFANLACPGIYAIAISDSNLAGSKFAWGPHIVYIGMSNAKAGLKGRLGQFHNTITHSSCAGWHLARRN